MGKTKAGQSRDLTQGALLPKIIVFALPLIATGILQLLERDGYIERVSVPTDARLKKIVLTAKANDLQTLVIREAERIDSLLKGGLSEEEVKLYIRLSERICSNIA